MKALFFLCNKYRAFNLKKSAIAKFTLKASSNKREELMNKCLLVFVTVEAGDSLRQAGRCLKDISSIAKANKYNNIVLAPFAHLSSRLAQAESAAELILHMEKILAKHKFYILRSSFGFEKDLKIDVKGSSSNIRWRSYSSRR